AEGCAQTWETRALDRQGRYRWARVSCQPRFEQGRFAGISGVLSDVSERRRTEEELARYASLLRATLESTADGILVVDTAGRITSRNQRFLDLWRISPGLADPETDDALLGSVLDQLKDPEAFLARVKDVYADPSAESFDVLEFRDGRVLERYSLPQRMEGVVVGRVWSFRDVTERRDAEKRAAAGLRQQAVLAHLGHLALTGVEWPVLMHEAARQAALALEVEWCHVLEPLADGTTLQLCAPEQSLPPGQPFTFEGAPKGCVCERVLLTTKPLIVDDIKTEKCFTLPPWLHGRSLRSAMVVPIPISGGPCGVLACFSDVAGRFTEDDVHFSQGIANLLAEVAERERAVAALRESNDYVENLLDHANAPVMVWDSQCRITRFNKELEVLSGRSAGEVLGMSPQVLFPARLADGAMALIRETLTGQRWEAVEIPIQHRDGYVRTVLWNAATLFAGDGTTPVATIAQGRDMTDHARAEKEIEARNRELEILYGVAGGLAAARSGKELYACIVRKLKEITGGTSASLGIYDPAQRYIRVKDEVADDGVVSDLIRALGGKRLAETPFPVSDDQRGELLRNPISYRSSLSEVTFGVVPMLVGKIAQKAQRIDRFLGIAYILGGELFGTSVVAFRAGVPDPSPALVKSFAEMVAESLRRVRAEEELRQSQLRLSGIIDSAMDAIITVDETETILVFNAGAEQAFGCPAAEAIGTSLERFIPERFHAVHHGHIERFGRTSDTLRTAGRSTSICGRRASGEEFPIEASISQTEVTGHRLFTIILRDVTEQVRGAQARAQLEGRLRVAQKMDALGTLAGGIAHDFNNILGTIIGNVELARQDVGSAHPAVTSLEEIRKASGRAKDLVQRILVFGRQQAQPQTVIALHPVVDEAVALLRATLPAGVELVTRFDTETPAVLADPTQIHQALMNLCTNAWHALGGSNGRIEIDADGITLDAQAARCEVNLRPGRFARLRVTDNGCGMDAATIEHIFEPFFTTKAVGQGTGLGLSVLHGIVEAHGGAITVTSELGRGTVFSLYFPAAQAPQESVAPQVGAAAALPEASGQHVLFLDDEESLVFLVTRLLTRLGYRVSGYTHVPSALAAVRADPADFDLVVTDLNMPGMSGLEVAREMARLRPQLPVVLASGYITDELRTQAQQAGVRRLIYKPNTVEELCEAVQHLAGEPQPRSLRGDATA
ncbi:MAG: PAS domain S-box protein, partial [Deltaproteobacteria bacterium]|nr:PAS domain S-box protein [Deltaproteobacteria bacterium]